MTQVASRETSHARAGFLALRVHGWFRVMPLASLLCGLCEANVLGVVNDDL